MPNRIVVTKLGGPEVLKYEKYDLPKQLNSDLVRIKQTSIGLNYIDTYHRSGLYPLPMEFPFCLGLEAAGNIIEVGRNVTDFSVDDRVAYSYSPPLGAYCEVRDFFPDKLVKIPNYITNDEAASILLQGMTVEYLLERLYKIKKNEKFLFHAAAGGVGLLACQWARSVGAEMIGTISNNEKAKLAKLNGCKYTINYKDEDVLTKVMELTKDQGVKVVYDGVGKDTFNTSLKCLSFRGLMVSFGQSSGMVDKIDLHSTFNPKSLYYTRPTLMHYIKNKEELKLSSTKLFKKIKNKEIKPNIFKKFKLEDADEAHKLIQSRKSIGSIILKP
tara:strand:- start:1699 stop:2685 length:987 start_codon:yes stop_codon:yes gene_type:complete